MKYRNNRFFDAVYSGINQILLHRKAVFLFSRPQDESQQKEMRVSCHLMSLRVWEIVERVMWNLVSVFLNIGRIAINIISR